MLKGIIGYSSFPSISFNLPQYAVKEGIDFIEGAFEVELPVVGHVSFIDADGIAFFKEVHPLHLLGDIAKAAPVEVHKQGVGFPLLKDFLVN